MKFLLDTKVVVELRKGAAADRRLLAWLERTHAEDLFLSSLFVGEARSAIEKMRGRDAGAANALDRWLERLVAGYEDRILPVDLKVAEEWGRMNVPDPISVVDGLMAATAKVHGLVLATRNVKDVAATGVRTLNPFAR